MDTLVVLSGGMDSTVALYREVAEKKGKVRAVTFNYGSKHNDEEYKRAAATCEKLDVGFNRIHLPLDDYFESNLLKSGGEIPEGHYAESNMKKTVVPFRNGIMLSVAAGFAESIGCQKLVLGNHSGDHAIYPDCRQPFINGMSKAIFEGTYSGVILYSPFNKMTKTDICKIGDSLKVDWSDTYSCYKGGETHCGRCSTCFERREAFHDARVQDPTVYLDDTPFESLRAEYNERYENDRT